MIALFTAITYQDYLRATDKPALAAQAVDRYVASPEFRLALDASAYFRGENPGVARKTVLQACKIETRDENSRRRVRSGTQDVVGNRIGSGFLFRFVTQQNQYLLSEGVLLPENIRRRLGPGFDAALEELGERALLHGVCWGYWNVDHLELLEAARDQRSGFVALLDEMSGEPMAGVQFWQVAEGKPAYLRLFEPDGVSVWSRQGGLLPVERKRPYLLTRSAGGVTGQNYDRLPVIPLYANSERRSELTPAIRAKIDAYDNILSDFADNLDRANDVYWVLNNFGGTAEDVAETLEAIRRVKAVANLSDGTGASSTAEPHTIEVPYAARQAALSLLERALYQDYMALNLQELTGGSLTNVAIRAAMANLDMKANRYEWQLHRFMHGLLSLLRADTEEIRFRRQVIANASETIADIAAMRGDIDRRTALRLNPYIQAEEIEPLLSSDHSA